MRKRRFLTIFSILLLIVGIFFLLKKPSMDNHNFVQLPVKFFPFIDQPTITIEIEDKKYSLLVDLGSSHPIDLHKNDLQKIKNKKSLGTSNYIGIRGKEYPTQAFQLSEIKLLNLTIDGLVAFEENLDFINDSKTWQSSTFCCRVKDQLELFTRDGRIGWTFFKEGTVFFDFPHSTLVIAKDTNSLMNEAGYALDNFTQIAFEIQKWGLVLSVETDLGSQKFLLDTGATCSIIRASLFNEKMQDSKLPYMTEKLKIGNDDFGRWAFRLFDYNDQMEVDGILGIDFFKKHSVCLDFNNKKAYIKQCKNN